MVSNMDVRLTDTQRTEEDVVPTQEDNCARSEVVSK